MSEKSRFHEVLSFEEVEGSVQLMTNDILIAAVKGELDLNLVASSELASRGFDSAGKWIGFPQAKQLHSARIEKKEWTVDQEKRIKQLRMEAEDMAAENRRLEAENTRLLKAAGKLK